MNVLVTASARFAVTPDGALWTPNSSLGYRFWTRYLDVFERVHLLVRARPEHDAPPGWLRATGRQVEPVILPFYHGPSDFARRLPELRRTIRSAVGNSHAVQLRLPCVLGELVRRSLTPGRPYAVEVVGDPSAVFASGAMRHPLRPLFRAAFVHCLRQACEQACAVSYVTERHLPMLYPSGPSAFRTYYSSIELPLEAIRDTPRSAPTASTGLTLLMVGTLDQLYKAPDVLIDAVAECVSRGADIRLRIVGDGKYRAALCAQVERHGLHERVSFLGQLPGPQSVRQELDRADLFVLPSRTEGLPKAMIEAMARALPCIGTSVGGIPELLPGEDMVPPGDASALAGKLREVLANPSRLEHMSRRNLAKAREYRADILRPRRIALYSHLEKATTKWRSI